MWGFFVTVKFLLWTLLYKVKFFHRREEFFIFTLLIFLLSHVKNEKRNRKRHNWREIKIGKMIQKQSRNKNEVISFFSFSSFWVFQSKSHKVKHKTGIHTKDGWLWHNSDQRASPQEKTLVSDVGSLSGVGKHPHRELA